MGCCGSAPPKPRSPLCTDFWATSPNEALSLKEEGQGISDAVAAWGRGELEGTALVEKVTGEILKVSRIGTAANAMATGAVAGGKTAANTVMTAMQGAAVQGSKAAGQNAPTSGTTGVGGAIGAVVGGLVGGIVGGMSAGMGSQKLFDHLDVLFCHSDVREIWNVAFKGLSTLENAPFDEVKRNFLQVAKTAHPENGGTSDDFFIACINTEVIRAISLNPTVKVFPKEVPKEKPKEDVAV